MPNLNAKFTHTRVLRSNGKIEACTIMSRTSQDDVMVRTTRAGTPFKAVTFLRTRNGRTIKFLQEDSGPTNLVTNGSFTTTNLSEFYRADMGYGSARDTSYYRTAPASLICTSYIEDDPTFAWYKATGIAGQKYSFSGWVSSAEAFGAIMQITTGSTTTNFTLNYSGGGWQYWKFENLTFTGTGGLGISFAATPAFYVDDVWVVNSATAV